MPTPQWRGSRREPGLAVGVSQPAVRDGVLSDEAAGGVVCAPAAPDLTSAVHLFVDFITSDQGPTWVDLLVVPILAPYRPAPAPRADEPEAVVERNAKQQF